MTDRSETEWQRLQRLKADAQERENQVAAGKLVWAEDVERTTAEVWQMVGSDLRHTLPTSVADSLTGRGVDPAEIRAIVRRRVDDLIAGWKQNVPDKRVNPSKAPAKKKRGRKRAAQKKSTRKKAGKQRKTK